jgi:hypothetical protein
MFDENNQRSRISWHGPLGGGQVQTVVSIFATLFLYTYYWRCESMMQAQVEMLHKNSIK